MAGPTLVAMSMMRHTDMRLTMNVYTDPRVCDMAGAVEKLPAMVAMTPQVVKATGTDDAPMHSGRTKSVTNRSAGIGYWSASTGKVEEPVTSTLTIVGDSDWQQKTPSGMDGVFKRAKGLEPSTFTLAT